MAKILVKLIVLLILSGMMLHEAIPHHHHSQSGHVHTCCESHEHNDAGPNDVQPCTILSSIQHQNLKPQIQIHSQDIGQNHINHHNDACNDCLTMHCVATITKTSIFIPQSVFSETESYHTYSFRGPPSA
ncbi:MAG: hypothetical protein RBT74_11970 [Tenuifilaceae bacterium]|nr:hypothetical protein [Tenuifilaceae bacterium]